MSKGFEFDNKFNTDNAFTSIKFGYDRPILETELNELQEIQNYNRKSLMHKICKSGIIDLVDKDFKGETIVYNPNYERNKIAIAPMRVNVNGYDIHVCGDYQINEINNYLEIDLGEPPSGNDSNTMYREDLVYLQVWFDEITSSDKIYRYGNNDCGTIENTLIDDRVGQETSHRMGLRWKVKVEKGVDFNKWEYGFGYNTSSANGYSPIKTSILKNINIINDIDKVFANATHYMFQGCNFYGDNNLWVAGRPYSLNHTIKIEPFIDKNNIVSNISLKNIGVKIDKKESNYRKYDIYDQNMDFFGKWNETIDKSGEKIKTTNDKDSYVILNFCGDNITLTAGNIIRKGKYIITIDNSSKYIVDLEYGNLEIDKNGNITILTVDTLNSYNFSANTKDLNYVFALPLFRITRRNQKPYSLLNPNGSIEFNNKDVNLRPDNKCYDMIYKSDILDLRKNVIINNNDIDYYLNNTLNKVFSGSLTTKSNIKMKRLQFGIEPLTGKENNIIFLDSFNQTNPPILGNTPIITKRNTSTVVNYCPSITKWGLNVDGNIKCKYDINSFDANEGTIDFFLSSMWNGFDDMNQYLFGLYNGMFNYPFLTVNKINNKLVIKRYADSTSTPHISSMNVNINNIIHKRIYHIRICWSYSQNKFECYINGKFAGNSLDEVIPSSSISVNQLIIGSIESLNSSGMLNNNMGFIIDEFTIYNIFKNDWNLPLDYIKGDCEILPSMNGLYRNFRDNKFTQENMVYKITINNNTDTFTFDAPYNTIFASRIPTMYCMSKTSTTPKNVNIGDEIPGMWSGLIGGSITFELNHLLAPIDKFTGETFLIVFDVTLLNDNIVDDVPIELLRAENYNINTKITKEVSFNVENNTNAIDTPREIQTLINKTQNKDLSYSYSGRRYIYDIWDTAFDFSTYKFKDNFDFSFSRLLEYNVSGNGTDLYSIESVQYGYDILYIRNAILIYNTTDGIKQEIPLNLSQIKKTIGFNGKTYFSIKIDRVVNPGNYIKFELALGGLVFDYNTNSKTFIGNMCSAEYLEFTATGDKFDYIIPCDNISAGICNKGIITALGTKYKHSFDSSGNENTKSDDSYEYICFIDDIMYSYQYLDGIGKPFLKIHLSVLDPITNMEMEVQAGKKIKIPIFVTCQPDSTNILSVWYNYIPYQGTLDNNYKDLRRLSDWKYFVTTLSSGNTNDNYNKPYSINNVVNHLPGGIFNSSLITGQDINLKTHDFSNFNSINNYNLNKNLIFIDQTYIGTISNDIDSYMFDLDTDYNVFKKYGKMQDDKININNKNFKIILPLCEQSISKYCGMACIVSDEFGDVYLFIVGDTNNGLPSTNNSISPKYGDLYIIPYRPGFINRR